MLFINKQKKVESSLTEYRQKVSTCIEIFENSILQYLESSDRAMLEKNCVEIHKAESLADGPNLLLLFQPVFESVQTLFDLFERTSEAQTDVFVAAER